MGHGAISLCVKVKYMSAVQSNRTYSMDTVFHCSETAFNNIISFNNSEISLMCNICLSDVAPHGLVHLLSVKMKKKQKRIKGISEFLLLCDL